MKVSSEERVQGRLTDEHLALALRSLYESGYVILEGVLPQAWVEEMRVAFDTELKRVTAGKEGEVEKSKGHYGTSAPLRLPFLDPVAIENPFALQIMEAVMGTDIFSYLPYGCNTAWPGSGVQHIHRDTGHLFVGTSYVLPVAMVVVNIPLVDFTVENGCTEVWPGSHLIADPDPAAALDLYHVCTEERAAQIPSARVLMPAGSVVVRDMRAWHRGMPNHTQTIRTMLALVYFRQFYNICHLKYGNPVPRSTWEQLSERTQRLYRYTPVAEG